MAGFRDGTTTRAVICRTHLGDAPPLSSMDPFVMIENGFVPPCLRFINTKKKIRDAALGCIRVETFPLERGCRIGVKPE